MDNQIQEMLDDYKKLVNKIRSYNEAINLMYWDLRTGAPKKAVEERSEVIGLLSSEVFNLMTSDKMADMLQTLLKPETKALLDEKTTKSLHDVKKEFDRNKKIPPEMYREYIILISKTEAVWQEAREKSDFKLFKPYLEKIVNFNKEFTDLWGYNGHRYNALLDQYEPEMTVEQLDPIFEDLKNALIPLVQKVTEQEPINTKFLRKQYNPLKQREFSMLLLKKMGFDFNAGRLDETVHPFQITLNHGDVRVTTKFEENDISVSLFGTMHEGGHAQYEQNINDELEEMLLYEGTSMAIHESQSRFWENIVGRSSEFWDFYYKELISVFPEQLENISKDDFYRAVNEIKASPIRTEADELTYNFHILIRYEIEKALINGDISVEDLPTVWNRKMEEYLGIVPEDDAHGVLQDVHWSEGMFGYFPTYALGNIYSAQFYHKMIEDLPELKDMLKRGNLIPIKAWLNKKIHQYGKLKTAKELVREVTGEDLNAKYFIDYLTTKIKEVYQL